MNLKDKVKTFNEDEFLEILSSNRMCVFYSLGRKFEGFFCILYS